MESYSRRGPSSSRSSGSDRDHNRRRDGDHHRHRDNDHHRHRDHKGSKRPRHHRHSDPDDHNEGPLRTHFKPDPNAPGTSTSASASSAVFQWEDEEVVSFKQEVDATSINTQNQNITVVRTAPFSVDNSYKNQQATSPIKNLRSPVRIKVEPERSEISIKDFRTLTENVEDNATDNSSNFLGGGADVDVKPDLGEVPVKVESDLQNSSAGQGQDECFDEEGRPLVTNFFQFASKPLPKIEPVHRGETGMNPPAPPQTPRYKLHTEAEETAYIKNDIPIQTYKNERDMDDDDADSSFSEASATTNSSSVGLRYFKKHEVLQKYKFDYYKYPNMKNLAVYQHNKKIIEEIQKNRVVVIEGFTGCGKTTQVPQFILDDCVQNNVTCNIVVTQPRRIAASSVARRVCDERGWDVGTVVGFQVGMDTQSNLKETMVTYVTTGVLLQKLIHSKTLKNYSHIIIDEVHERNLETDFLLLVIKKILMEDRKGHESHVKIILMSATMNAPKFSNYFRFRTFEDDAVVQAPIVKIGVTQGKFKVDEIFLDSFMAKEEMNELEFSKNKALLHNDIYDAAVKIIVGLDKLERGQAFENSSDPRMKPEHYSNLKLENRGSVLVFLPGLMEIQTLLKKLEDESKNTFQTSGGDIDYKWTLIPLHSTITFEEQSKVFKPAGRNHRKIIFSTNIAESSITVPDVVYVIDFCLTKSMNVDPRTNFSCLQLMWASLSQCTQRKGRTGRVAPGIVYRLVPTRFYSNELDSETCPEMMKSGLESVILRVKNLEMGSPKDILGLALDAPPQSGIERAIVNLKEVGALTTVVTNSNSSLVYDPCDGDMTFLGKVMSQLPIPHQCARLIMLGHVFGVMKESIIIAAGLSGKSPFNSPFQRRLESYLSKLNWARRSYSDCIAILNLYREWTSKFGDSDGTGKYRQEKAWSNASFVQLSALREIRSVVEELERRIKNLGIEPSPLAYKESADGDIPAEQTVLLKVAIAGAFYPNYFHRQRPANDYQRERSREANGQDLFSTVYFKGFPQDRNGTLYAKHVSQKLTLGYDIPVIQFDGQKVLAMFDSTGDKIGPINKAVYRAVKLRQIREKVEFDTFSNKQEEDDYLDWQNKLRQESGMRYIHCPDQIQLPGVGVPEFFFFATHIVSPSQFWVVCTGNEDELNEISQNIVAGRDPSERRLNDCSITPGSFCLAPFSDDYYRARIRAVEPRRALVYFVDYGNSAWVNDEELRPFSQTHIKAGIHEKLCLAIECRLSNIKPSIFYGSVWNYEALSKFSGFLNNSNYIMKMEIHSVHKCRVNGTVCGMKRTGSEENSRRLNVNDMLVSEGYADRIAENSSCQLNLNHDARKRINLIRRDQLQIDALNKAQKEGGIQDIFYVDPPVAKQGKTRRTELKGPWSPLELEFASLCYSSSSKPVTIDDGSVNSVTLDQEPAAPTSRLVVAASVAIQDKSQRVMARDTTTMPAVPGLMALMAMVFAPKIELRLDNHQSRYTGVLCGLGTDPDPTYNNIPIYQDHDMEIVFDTVIDDADISAINRIRCHMNRILQSSFSRPASHKEVVEEMIMLLKRDRNSLEEKWPVEMYSWGKIDPTQIVRPPPKFAYERNDIFIPHSTVNLITGFSPNASWGNRAI